MAHPKVILDLLQAAPRKKWSQNFLTSPHWADKLTAPSLASDADEIWEIGPGLGALTDKLVSGGTKPVRVFEIDPKAADYLEQNYGKHAPRWQIIRGDFMDSVANETQDGPSLAVLSNLPYHLSSAVVFRLIDLKKRVRLQTLTFQREYAHRCRSKSGSKDYGILSVAIALHYDVESLGIIPPKAFYPAPDVDSEALIFRPRQAPEEAPEAISLARHLFHQRRKTIGSTMARLFERTNAEAVIQKAGLTPDRRPETLSPLEFVEVVRCLHGIGLHVKPWGH